MALTSWDDVFENIGVEATGMAADAAIKRTPVLRSLPSNVQSQIRAAPETIYNLIDNAQEFSSQ